jgi:peptidoglycan hydrolase CwlO-like protein
VIYLATFVIIFIVLYLWRLNSRVTRDLIEIRDNRITDLYTELSKSEAEVRKLEGENNRLRSELNNLIESINKLLKDRC